MAEQPDAQQSLTERVVIVTGGAGFVGSHLVDRLVEHTRTEISDARNTKHLNALMTCRDRFGNGGPGGGDCD